MNAHVKKIALGLVLAGLALPAFCSQTYSIGGDLLYGKPFKSTGFSGEKTDDWGGQLRAEWQAMSWMDLGVGYSQTRLYLGSAPGRTQVGALDLTGRLLSPWMAGGFQPFILGGMGYNVFGVSAPNSGHYHGQAVAGLRYNFGAAINADMGVAYNFTSPISAALNMGDFRMGLNYVFGL
jgi:hypothetical protein